MHAVLTLLTLVGIQLTLNSIAIQTGALSPEVPLHLRQAMLHELPHLWKLLPLKPLRSVGVVLHSAALPTSAKNNFCLCDLSEKRHRVFFSVASVASVVPLCRLCGKKALCTFLNEISLFFH